MSERMFPVLYGHTKIHARGGWPMQVPWRLLAPHARQAMRNHEQTLQRLAERGGLSLCEMLAVLEDRPWHRMDHDDARARVEALVAALPPITNAEPEKRG